MNKVLTFQDNQRHRRDAQVVIVGGGPIGLSIAIDLAERGISIILLEKRNSVFKASRAICYSKESLSYFERIGIYHEVLKKGVRWSTAKTYYEDTLISTVDYAKNSANHYPAFVNLQQYYVEELLIARAKSIKNIDFRLGHELIGVDSFDSGVTLEVSSREGTYKLRTRYLLAADGVHSFVRGALGLTFEGNSFHDKFLVIDFHTEKPMPNERRFWFNPPFSQGRSALLLPQSDNIWRLDFQIGPESNDDHELSEESLRSRMMSMFGDSFEYKIVFSSIYRFNCRRMATFRHKNIFFLGDAAHVVSPFGARGANSGFQDAENLAWRLDWVINKDIHDTLLDGYSFERVQAAHHNIIESTRSTDFISPATDMNMAFRNAILKLSKKHTFAKKLMNCGKLYSASPYYNTDLSNKSFVSYRCPDISICYDLRKTWLLTELGNEFSAIIISRSTRKLDELVTYLSDTHLSNFVKPLFIVVNNESKTRHSKKYFFISSSSFEESNLFSEHIFIIRPDKYIGSLLPIDQYSMINQSLHRMLGGTHVRRRVG